MDHTVIHLTTTTTKDNHLLLQCNGSGLHHKTKLQLYYGPNQEQRECIGPMEDTGPHVVCQHTIVNPNKTHSGHYYCQVDPSISTCNTLKSETVHVHVQTSATSVSTNDASTIETQYIIIIVAVVGMALTSLVSFSLAFGCCLYSRLKPIKDNEGDEEQQGM